MSILQRPWRRSREHTLWGERSAPWEPDLLLASQLPKRWATTAERRLLLAVMEQALDDMRRPPVSDGDVVRYAAIGWVLWEGDEPWSFRWCCRQLGLHVDAVRKALSALDWRPHLVPGLDERRHQKRITPRSAGIWT